MQGLFCFKGKSNKVEQYGVMEKGGMFSSDLHVYVGSVYAYIG
jgi:hypothetical protein